MSVPIKEVRPLLKKLGVKGHQTGDGRTYFAVPYTDTCGETVPWIVVIYSRRRRVESLGAYCQSCRKVLAIPLDQLRLLGARPISSELERMAARLEEELKSNLPWFEERMGKTAAN